MSIDWKKAREDLNKTQKVKSQVLVDLREKVEFLEVNLTQAKHDLRLMSEQFNNSEKANLRLISENESLKNKVIESDGVISELRTVKNDLINKVDSLCSENEKITKESEQLKKQFETEIADLTSAYESKINEIKLSEKQREDLLESLRNEFKIYSESSEKLKNENEEIKEENSKLKSKVSEEDIVISKLNEEIEKAKKLIDSKNLIIEEIKKEKEEEYSESYNQLDNYQSYSLTRIRCPSCNSTGSDIKEIEDRDKILYYVNHKPIYAKKNKCIKCGYKF